jgi:hypothetical protein
VRMLVWRSWICHFSWTSSRGCNGSWSKLAYGHSPVDVPHRLVPRCMQRVCSSTHKASLVMVLLRILEW